MAETTVMNIGHFRAEYSVAATSGICSYLAPVTFSVHSRGFYWQDYLTPDDAEQLADALRDVAWNERRRLARVREDLTVIADAARTPHTPEAA